jgi:hypothetical protein
MTINFINLKIQSLSGLKCCETSILYFKDYLPYQNHLVLHYITFDLKAIFIYTAVCNLPVFMQRQWMIIYIHQHMHMVEFYVTGVHI